MDNPLDGIYWRDEILQILFWFRGEGLGEAVTPRDLVTFLSADETFVRGQLERLVDEGYVARCPEDALGYPPSGADERALRYQLTAWGVKEGGRRFADEFEGLTGQAHGECNNPNCSCKTMGPEACEGRTAHAH